MRHDFQVQNAGNATISEIWLWIEDGDGKVVSTRAGGHVALAPRGGPGHMAVEVRQPLPDEQTLMVRWRDSDGEHAEPTGIRPPLHM